MQRLYHKMRLNRYDDCYSCDFNRRGKMIKADLVLVAIKMLNVASKMLALQGFYHS
jgi:hypothetical protein